jgi:hypothetical protein
MLAKQRKESFCKKGLPEPLPKNSYLSKPFHGLETLRRVPSARRDKAGMSPDPRFNTSVRFCAISWIGKQFIHSDELGQSFQRIVSDGQMPKIPAKSLPTASVLAAKRDCVEYPKLVSYYIAWSGH